MFKAEAALSNRSCVDVDPYSAAGRPRRALFAPYRLVKAVLYRVLLCLNRWHRCERIPCFSSASCNRARTLAAALGILAVYTWRLLMAQSRALEPAFAVHGTTYDSLGIIRNQDFCVLQEFCSHRLLLGFWPRLLPCAAKDKPPADAGTFDRAHHHH